MTTIASLLVKLGVDTSEFVRGMDDASGRARKFGEKAQSLGRDLSVGLTVPLAAVGLGAIKASVDFESAFAGVRKTVEATEEQFAELRSGILAMTREVPASANEISRVAEAAGQLGVATEDILGFTRVMIDLGESTNMSSLEAADALARFTNITGLSRDQISNLGSTVVDLGNKMAATESEIVQMGARIAGAGVQVGLTDAQIMAFAAALSSLSIEVEAGGTAISRTFIDIAKAVNTGSDELDIFATVAGMSVGEFSRLFKQDAAGAVLAFVKGLGDVADAGGDVFGILEDLGITERRQQDAVLRLASGHEQLAKALGIAGTAFDENTALSEEAARRYETTGAKLEIFRNRLMETAIELGDTLAPAMLSALDAADPFIRMLEMAVDVFVALPQPVQTTVIGFAALLAALGPIVFIGGQMISTFGALVQAFMAVRTGIVVAQAAVASFSVTLAAVLPTLGLLTVALGAAYVAWKLFGNSNADEAARRQEAALRVLNSTTEENIRITQAQLQLRLEELKAEDERIRSAQRFAAVGAEEVKANATRQQSIQNITATLATYDLAVGMIEQSETDRKAATDDVITATEAMQGQTEQTVPVLSSFEISLRKINGALDYMTGASDLAFGALDKFRNVPTQEQLNLNAALADVNFQLELNQQRLDNGTAAAEGNYEQTLELVSSLETERDRLNEANTLLGLARDSAIEMGKAKAGASGQVYGLVSSEEALIGMVAEATGQLAGQGDVVGNLASLLEGLGMAAENGMASMVAAIYAATPNLTLAAAGAAIASIETFNDVYQIHSPSRVMQQIGHDVIDGLVLGIEDGTNTVAQLATHLGFTLIDNLSGAIDQGAPAVQASIMSIADMIAKWGEGIVADMTATYMAAVQIASAIAAQSALGAAAKPVLGSTSVATTAKVAASSAAANLPNPHAASPASSVAGLTQAQVDFIDYMNRVQGAASGGYVPATPGGVVLRVAEGGEGEYIVPESKMGGGMGGAVYVYGDIVLPNVQQPNDFARELQLAVVS